MNLKTPNRPTLFWLLTGLMALSTVFFAVGITLERNGEAAETVKTTLASGELTETQAAPAGENAEVGGEEQHPANVESAETHPESTAVQEAAHAETILGINIESPFFIIGAVIVWAALIVGLFLFGHNILIPVIVVAIGTGIFDIAEIITQINRSNTGLTLLAAVIAVAHIAVAVMALILYQRRNITQQMQK